MQGGSGVCCLTRRFVSVSASVPRLYMISAGTDLHRRLPRELAQEEDLVFLAGHYEGIDERAFELIVDRFSFGGLMS